MVAIFLVAILLTPCIYENSAISTADILLIAKCENSRCHCSRYCHPVYRVFQCSSGAQAKQRSRKAFFRRLQPVGHSLRCLLGAQQGLQRCVDAQCRKKCNFDGNKRNKFSHVHLTSRLTGSNYNGRKVSKH